MNTQQQTFDRTRTSTHLMAVHGVILTLPEESNITLLRAKPDPWWKRLATRTPYDPSATGALVISDLRGPRFEIRWRTLPNPNQTLEAMARRLKQKGISSHRPWPNTLSMQNPNDPSRWELLSTESHRLYELSFPAGEDPLARCVIETFIHSNQTIAPSASRDRLWSLYGATGNAPRDARVRTMKLHPGHVELVLAYRGGRTTFGSQSLADHLLKTTTILAWAKQRFHIPHATGQWAQESDGEATFIGLACKKFCRRIRHHLRVLHNPQANRLQWEHVERWGAQPGDSAR